jgi:hypothetical protein
MCSREAHRVRKAKQNSLATCQTAKPEPVPTEYVEQIPAPHAVHYSESRLNTRPGIERMISMMPHQNHGV